jgi:hypothetical protein
LSTATRALRYAALWLATSWATPLGAQPDPYADEAEPAADVGSAIALGREGFDLYGKRQFQRAHDTFARAEAATHSPVFVLYMARCKKNMSRLLEAKALYDRVLADDVSSSSPAPWVEAQADARRESAALDAELPEVTLSLTGLAAGDVVLVDDIVVHDGVADRSVVDVLTRTLRLDPGEHTLTVTRAGRPEKQHSFQLAIGDRQRVPLILAHTPPPKAAPPIAPIAPAPDTADPSPMWPTALAFGAGGVGLVLGSIAGGVALSQASEAESYCDDGIHCEPDGQAAGDRARTLAHVSTAAFIVGAASVAVGVVLLLTRDDDPRATALHVAPGGVGFSQRF